MAQGFQPPTALASPADAFTGGINPPADEASRGSGAVYVYGRSGGSNWATDVKLKAAMPNQASKFGHSTSISADAIATGSPDEGAGENRSGAVYVFRKGASGLVQEARLLGGSPANGDEFGWSISLSGDTLVVGGQGRLGSTGPVYVFRRSSLGVGGTWAQSAYIKASNIGEGDRFGAVVAIHGNAIVVGAPREDSSATGLNGNQGDASGSPYDNSGAAYQCDLAPDCNANGIDGSVELAGGGADCNGNGPLDSCDIAAGGQDCDANGVLDACQPDVNADGIGDACQGGATICHGDGQGTNCPCSNNGAAGNGCANSATNAGSNLVSSGLPSHAFDSLRVVASGIPSGSKVPLFQGRGVSTGVVFGDGLRCVTDTLVRLGNGVAATDGFARPQAGAPSLSLAGGIPAAGGVTRHCQVWCSDIAPG